MMREVSFALVLTAAGCGRHRPPEAAVTTTVYHTPTKLHPLLEAPPGEVSEALQAAPALELPAHVAVFSPDEPLAESVAAGLQGSQGIASTYVIRRLLVDGQPRFQGHYPYASFYGPRPPMDVDLEELRTLAAAAHCDALLIVDSSWQQRGGVSGWVVLSPLLLTMLFTPWLDLEYYSYLDMYLVDVRTGYLYGQISSEQTLDLGASTVYQADNIRTVTAQREQLAAGSKDELSDLLWYHLMKLPGAEAR